MNMEEILKKLREEANETASEIPTDEYLCRFVNKNRELPSNLAIEGIESTAYYKPRGLILLDKRTGEAHIIKWWC